MTTEVEGVNITNVYKPHGTRLSLDSIPRYQQHCISVGFFNCHSTTRGCSCTNTDGTTLEHWASSAEVTLLRRPSPGCHKGLIPTWDEECQQLYDEFVRAEP